MPKPGATTEVEGVATLVATLGDARDGLEVLAPPEAGAYIRDKARAAAPHVSGTLRASIVADYGPATVTVGSALVYAPVIHNGWADHNISPNPFLVPVAEETAPIWGREYAKTTSDVLKKVKGA